MFKLFFIYFIIITNLFAGTIQIDGSKSVYELGTSLEVLVDPANSMQFKDIVNATDYQTNDSNHKSYGFTSSAYWAKVTIQNLESIEKKMYLVQREQALDYWDVYIQREDSLEKHFLGDMRPISNREFEHRYSVVPLVLNANETITLYQRHQASQAIILSIGLYETDAFMKNDAYETIFYSVIFGILFIMIIYNFFIWTVMQENAYLYYIAYAFSQLVLQFFSVSGFAYWILPSFPLEWYSHIYLYMQNALMIFISLFTMSFLETKKHVPKMHLFFKINIYIFLAFTLIHAVTYIPILEELNLMLGLIASYAFVLAGFYLWVKKQIISASYYTVAWSFFTVGITVSLLGFLGAIEVTFFVKTAVALGTALEVILLSLALADKFRTLKEEREGMSQALIHEMHLNAEYQKKVLKIKEMQASELEQEVLRRTCELEEINRELKYLSITDKLSGLYNRQKLDEVLQSEFQRSKRSKRKFGLIILDIDDFKTVNDTHGHQVGDEIIIEIANILKINIRQVDTVGRWGGEEFMIICPDTDLTGVKNIADKLRDKIANFNFSVIHKKTASFGVSTFELNDTITQLVARTDGALYRAKERGKNQVVVF